MSAVVYANAKTIHQLSSEPSGHARKRHGEAGNDEGQRAGIARAVPTQNPCGSEQNDDDDVAHTVQQPYALRPRPSGDGKEVDQAEYCCDQSADDPGSDHVGHTVVASLF